MHHQHSRPTTDATNWHEHYDGFHYEEFWEFIVDYFEVDQSPEARDASTALLEWWNKYICCDVCIVILADIISAPQASLSEVFGHTRSNPDISTTDVFRDPSTTATGRPFIPPALVATTGSPNVILFRMNDNFLIIPYCLTCEPQDQGPYGWVPEVMNYNGV